MSRLKQMIHRKRGQRIRQASMAGVLEVLVQSNPILADLPWQQADPAVALGS
jgi:hypothetical protein